jgi:Tol biopolymer transport system component
MRSKTLSILVLCLLFFGCEKSNIDERIILHGYGPSISPKENVVAFLGIEGQIPDVELKGYIWDISEKKALGNFGYGMLRHSSISWSPDGKKIAAVGSADGKSNIWIFDPWGNEEPIMMTDYQRKPYKDLWRSSDAKIGFTIIHGMQNPSWSPTGEYIAYSYHDQEKMTIWIVSTNDKRMEQLTQGPRDDEPCFSSDGSSIIYTACSCENRREIMQVILKDRTIHPLISSPYKEAEPVWSPDGNYIAFVSDRDGTDQIWVRSLPDSLEYQFTTEKGVSCYTPTWTPDGRYILYHKGEIGGIWMKEFDFEKLRTPPVIHISEH